MSPSARMGSCPQPTPLPHVPIRQAGAVTPMSPSARMKLSSTPALPCHYAPSRSKISHLCIHPVRNSECGTSHSANADYHPAARTPSTRWTSPNTSKTNPQSESSTAAVHRLLPNTSSIARADSRMNWLSGFTSEGPAPCRNLYSAFTPCRSPPPRPPSTAQSPLLAADPPPAHRDLVPGRDHRLGALAHKPAADAYFQRRPRPGLLKHRQTRLAGQRHRAHFLLQILVLVKRQRSPSLSTDGAGFTTRS